MSPHRRNRARSCVMQQRFPHLHAAEAAATTEDRPRLCGACGGFHLAPAASQAAAPATTSAATVRTRA